MMMFADENIENQVNAIAPSISERNLFIKNALKDLSLNVEVKVDELDKSVLSALEKLINQRDHWRKESNTFSQEACRVHAVNESMRRDREQQDLLIDSLKRDITTTNARTSSLRDEHRVVKQQWLAEKSELEKQLRLIESQNSLIVSTSKKKEQEFDRLKAQLAKLQKDTSRASKPAILVSAPHRGLGLQDAKSALAGLLRDAEVRALRNSLSSVEKDNRALRTNLESIETDLHQLQCAFDEGITTVEEKYKLQIEALREDKLQFKRFAERTGPALLSEPTVTAGDCIAEKSVNSSVPASTPDVPARTVQFQSALKTPASTMRQCLNSTPGARPLQWLVQQANTEMKKLRSRAECVAAETSWEEISGNARIEVVSLRTRLAEALLVIKEQDRLIQQALVSKVPVSQPETSLWEDEANEELRENDDKADSSAINFDFPPASPDTLQLLESLGWSIPRISSAKSSLGTEMVESCAEQLEFD